MFYLRQLAKLVVHSPGSLTSLPSLRSETLSISAAWAWLTLVQTGKFAALAWSARCPRSRFASFAATAARWLSVRCRRCRFRLMTKRAPIRDWGVALPLPQEV